MNKEKNSLPINLNNEELEQKLLEETDIDSMKNIINLFNLNIKKKDIVRTAKLNELQDKVYDQMDKRLTHKADEFSNADLLNYYKTIQESINKSDTTLDRVDTPALQIIQNQLNVNTNENELSRESKQKVIDLVQKIINASTQEKKENVQSNVIDADYEQLELSFE